MKPDIDFHYCADPHAALGLAANHLQPTVILQDLIMPGVDGLSLGEPVPPEPGHLRTPRFFVAFNQLRMRRLRARHLPWARMITWSSSPTRIESSPGLRYHTRAYVNQVQREVAFRALRESQQQLLESNAELIKFEPETQGGHRRPSPPSWRT